MRKRGGLRLDDDGIADFGRRRPGILDRRGEAAFGEGDTQRREDLLGAIFGHDAAQRQSSRLGGLCI